MHQNNLELFKRHGLPLIKPGDKVLEIAPDWLIPGGMCRPLIQEAKASYHFCNLENNHAGHTGYVAMDGPYGIVAPGPTFDVVFSLSVIEHVPKIWQWLREQRRVLEQGGLIICVNPTSWPYHESPVDCWRIYPEGYKALFESIGLEHVFTFEGNVVDLEDHLRPEHGPHVVRDCIAIARKSA
jgi:SAM-dependent methyltransferase